MFARSRASLWDNGSVQGQMMAKPRQQVKGLNPGSRVLDFKVANPMSISVPQ